MTFLNAGWGDGGKSLIFMLKISTRHYGKTKCSDLPSHVKQRFNSTLTKIQNYSFVRKARNETNVGSLQNP